MQATNQKLISRDRVEKFNAKHPVGSLVDVKMDTGVIKRTTVKYPAEVSASGHSVVWLNGISGYYLTERVEPVEGGAA